MYRLRDLYPDDAQHADDVVWIAEAGRRSLAVLTCDGRIRTTAHELAAVEAAGVKVFHVPAGQSASESIRLYTNNINRIVQRCARSGPAWYAVRQNSLDLMWEPAGH